MSSLSFPSYPKTLVLKKRTNADFEAILLSTAPVLQRILIVLQLKKPKPFSWNGRYPAKRDCIQTVWSSTRKAGKKICNLIAVPLLGEWYMRAQNALWDAFLYASINLYILVLARRQKLSEAWHLPWMAFTLMEMKTVYWTVLKHALITRSISKRRIKVANGERSL